ncbi:uncharacterized protein PFL1_02267 [Pseudozyma flocculosa PF-1]|uniref:uncharacterized protein n=1 Tax=Pseudozyma flocculosa PF-1 TaxID=1277687 RepID=UPI0004560E46|nr:uncharacterized protein PFL1_02267 [Pseudozyma flocculosa PF-1]EPQ30150.1 hypothetical protein PFL1_02267 [Pseudozyma flocculosa PF-1]
MAELRDGGPLPQAGPSVLRDSMPPSHSTEAGDTPQPSSRQHLGLKRVVSHRSPHGHSGSGAGLWLAGSPRRSASVGSRKPSADGGPQERASDASGVTPSDGPPRAGQRMYHFPATLAGGPARPGSGPSSMRTGQMMSSWLGLDGLDTSIHSTPSEVDLDLSFDYVSKMEPDTTPAIQVHGVPAADAVAESPPPVAKSAYSRAPQPISPSHRQIRGMASADWEKRKKAPPAPLPLQSHASSSRSGARPTSGLTAGPARASRTIGLPPHSSELFGQSVFSPLTPDAPTSMDEGRGLVDDGDVLPLTPLSATRRASRLQPSAKDFDQPAASSHLDAYLAAVGCDLAPERSTPPSPPASNEPHRQHGQAQRPGPSRSVRRPRSNTASTSASTRPPRPPPPTGPLPSSPLDLSHDAGAAPDRPRRTSVEKQDGPAALSRGYGLDQHAYPFGLALQPSLADLTNKSSSMASFQTAESSDLEVDEAEAALAVEGTAANHIVGSDELSPRQGSSVLGSTPMLLSASDATVKSGSSSDQSSFSPTSHCSPMTPFTPLFVDQGSGKPQVSNPADWHTELAFGGSSNLTAEAIRLARQDFLPPSSPAIEVAPSDWRPTVAADVVGLSTEEKERRQTELWILAQRQRRAELQHREMQNRAGTTIKDDDKDALDLERFGDSAEPAQRDRKSTAGSSSDDYTRPKQVLVISTASSPSDTLFGQPRYPFPVVPASSRMGSTGDDCPLSASMDRNAMSSNGSNERAAPPMVRNRSGTTGPWAQSPLLLSPDATITAPLPPPSPAGTTIIHHLEDDEQIDVRDPLVDVTRTDKALFEPASHGSTRAPVPREDAQSRRTSLSQREVKSASAVQTSFGEQALLPKPAEHPPLSFGLGLGLALDPASLDGGATKLQKARSDQDLAFAYSSRRPSLAGSTYDGDNTGSPYLAIDMFANPAASTRQDGQHEVRLQRSSMADKNPSLPGPALAGALGLHLGLADGASPVLPDDCRSPRTVSGKQHGSNTAGGIDALLGSGNTGKAIGASIGAQGDVAVHRAVTNLRPNNNDRALPESGSTASNISAFIYNPTPPSPLYVDAFEHPSNFVDLDLDVAPGKGSFAPPATSHQEPGKGRWRARLWNAVGSAGTPGLNRAHSIKTMEEGNVKRPPFRTLTLLSRRPSASNATFPAAAAEAAEVDAEGREMAAGDARRVTEQLVTHGSFSAPPTSLLPNDEATFAVSQAAPAPTLRQLELEGLTRAEIGRPLLAMADMGATKLQRANSSGGSTNAKAARRMSAAERKQKRSSGIAYIKDDGEVVSPWSDPSHGRRMSTQAVPPAVETSHHRRTSMTVFGGKERAVDPTPAGEQPTAASNPLEGLKSPRVAPSPSGFTPRMRFDPTDWGSTAAAVPAAAPGPTLAEPAKAMAPIMDASHTGLTLEEVERSRARLRLLANRTDQTTPSHQERSAPSSFSALHQQGPASAKVQRPDPTFGLHRRSRTARFANELAPGLDEPEGSGHEEAVSAAATRPPTGRLHTFGEGPAYLGGNRLRRNSMLASSMATFAAPSRYLDSATPSKSMFWAGFLGMPWLWLIGGWWLDADGRIVSRQPKHRVEFWHHEPSMAAAAASTASSLGSSPTLHQGEFEARSNDGSAPQRSDTPLRTLRSQNTFASLHSHYSHHAASFVSSAGTASTANVTHADPRKIPRSRTKSLASLIDRQPEVALYQSPVRVVEAPPSLASGASRSFSRAGTPLAQLAEMEETTQESEEYERLRAELVAKARAARNAPADSVRSSTEGGHTAASTEAGGQAHRTDAPTPTTTTSAGPESSDEAFTHPFVRPLRRQWTAETMVSQHALLAQLGTARGPLAAVRQWGQLERYVLYNRIAAIFGSLVVLAGCSSALQARARASVSATAAAATASSNAATVSSSGGGGGGRTGLGGLVGKTALAVGGWAASLAVSSLTASSAASWTSAALGAPLVPVRDDGPGHGPDDEADRRTLHQLVMIKEVVRALFRLLVLAKLGGGAGQQAAASARSLVVAQLLA